MDDSPEISAMTSEQLTAKLSDKDWRMENLYPDALPQIMGFFRKYALSGPILCHRHDVLTIPRAW